MRKLALLLLSTCLLLMLLLSVAAGSASAAIDEVELSSAASAYNDFTPYDQIRPTLDAIVAQSPRVHYEVIGTSAGGRELYLVIVADPAVYADLGTQTGFRSLMLSDPSAAQARLAADADVKSTVFINCSIHGDEPNGVDAGLRMVRRLAFADLATDAEAKAILDNCVVLFNICQNPDGRVAYTRANGNGFDLNRDFLTLSQPETRATVAQTVRWLPTAFFDLHGYYNPMLIEPCTAPHNPNYEYDLFIKWALPEAYAMRAAVTDHTNGNTAYPGQPGRHDVRIPYVDSRQGFDDFSPLYTPQFAVYYGSTGHTLETFSESDLGTDGHFWASWSGTLYAAQHRTAMLHDQIEQLRRGVTGFQQPDVVFPAAYVIPAAQPAQRDPQQAARAVEQLLFAGVRVSRAATDFVADGRWYSASSYVVPMDQPLRCLANTWLWKGIDVTPLTNSPYSVVATNLPELLGFDRVAVKTPFAVTLVPVGDLPTSAVPQASQYVLADDTNGAVEAVNALLADGATVRITTAAASGLPVGTFVVSGASHGTLTALSGEYHITFTPRVSVPVPTKTLRPPKLAVASDAATRSTLSGLGFDFTSIRATSSLTGYDVVVGSNTSLSASNVKAFVNGGGTYVAVGYSGMSGPLGNLLPVTLNVTNDYASNALVRARYDRSSLVGAYFAADDWAFVYRPVWFTSVGAATSIDARYRNDPDWYICGFWGDRAKAAGKPAVVSGAVGKGKVVYIGFAPTFRAYPEHTYRLLANAIWYGLK